MSILSRWLYSSGLRWYCREYSAHITYVHLIYAYERKIFSISEPQSVIYIAVFVAIGPSADSPRLHLCSLPPPHTRTDARPLRRRRDRTRWTLLWWHFITINHEVNMKRSLDTTNAIDDSTESTQTSILNIVSFDVIMNPYFVRSKFCGWKNWQRFLRPSSFDVSVMIT